MNGMEGKAWIAGLLIVGVFVIWLGGGFVLDVVIDLFQNPEYRTAPQTEQQKFNYFE